MSPDIPITHTDGTDQLFRLLYEELAKSDTGLIALVEEMEFVVGSKQKLIDLLQKELSETNEGLIALAMELEQRVDERTAELQSAREELQQTNAGLLQLTMELENRVARRTEELVNANAALHQEIAERKRLEQVLRDHHAHLEDLVRERTAELQAETANHRRTAARVAGINRVFQQSPICATEEDLGKVCLAVAEAISSSRFGFIGLLNPDGLFDTLAISDPGWDACGVPLGQAIPVGRNMPLRGVDRTTLREGRSRIVNGEEAILAHRDHVPTPDGHPPLRAFMGVPLKQGDRTVGMIGLGNKAGGYDEHDQEDVEVLAQGFVEALYHKRAALAVDRLNQDLARRAVELEMANKDLESFSYSVSHDLRAPLRAIDGFIAILAEEQAERLDDEGKRMFGIVADNARRMGDLIDDILAFSRAGRMAVDLTETNMRALVDRVWADLTELGEGRAIEFRVGELPPAACDPRAIRQVWQNLLANALKFTRGRDPAVIEVDARSEGNLIRYSVQDNGVGFSNEYVGKLFVLFQRLHGMDEFEGTGVGLAIVKRFVQKHGGEVHAEGVPEHGARFSFTLPRSSLN